MEVHDWVRSRAHRILKKMPEYVVLESVEIDRDAMGLDADEEVLGLYKNGSSDLSPQILVTTKALHLLERGNRTKLYFENMDDVSFPGEMSKLDVDHLIICSIQGEETRIYFEVVRGKLRDVWEFGRFMMRVIEDVKRVKEQATR